jgi:hypothetical protein
VTPAIATRIAARVRGIDRRDNIRHAVGLPATAFRDLNGANEATYAKHPTGRCR